MFIALDDALIYIVAMSTRLTLPSGLAVLHTMLWKFFALMSSNISEQTLDCGQVRIVHLLKIPNSEV